MGIVLNDKCLQALFSVPTPPGIDISVEFFGTFKGISSPSWQMAKTLESWGLTEGKTYFGAPFDSGLWLHKQSLPMQNR